MSNINFVKNNKSRQCAKKQQPTTTGVVRRKGTSQKSIMHHVSRRLNTQRSGETRSSVGRGAATVRRHSPAPRKIVANLPGQSCFNNKAKRPNNLQLILEAWDPLSGYEAFLGDLEPVIQARKDIKIIFGGDFNA